MWGFRGTVRFIRKKLVIKLEIVILLITIIVELQRIYFEILY